MKKHSRICIGCPAGCHLEILENDDGSFTVSGNTCPRGEVYAQNEMRDPRRVVTAVVPVNSRKTACLPVKTDAPLPVARIGRLLKKLYSMHLEVPVKAGMVLIRDFEGTSVNVVLTRGAEE